MISQNKSKHKTWSMTSAWVEIERSRHIGRREPTDGRRQNGRNRRRRLSRCSPNPTGRRQNETATPGDTNPMWRPLTTRYVYSQLKKTWPSRELMHSMVQLAVSWQYKSKFREQLRWLMCTTRADRVRATTPLTAATTRDPVDSLHPFPWPTIDARLKYEPPHSRSQAYHWHFFLLSHNHLRMCTVSTCICYVLSEPILIPCLNRMGRGWGLLGDGKWPISQFRGLKYFS